MLPDSLITYLKSRGSRLLLHLLFWFAAACFLAFFFGHHSGNYHYTFIFVCLLMPITIGTTYFINYVLIPRYLLQKHYGRFSMYFLFTMVFSVWAIMLVMLWAFIHLAKYQYSNMNPLTGNIFLLAVALYFIVFFSTSIKLLKHWYSSEKNVSELRSLKLEAELKLKETELQLLKGQIHPHFLFNTLNNLYGLALEKSDEMPDAIIRLSGLLDALLYRNQEKRVTLRDELKLIEDYIALEKLRLEDRLALGWQIDAHAEDYTLAPFLLFPFIENAFKHGFADDTEKLWLEIRGAIKEKQLIFSVTNSVNAACHASPRSQKGIGLQNVQRRLQLLYPGQHQLHITAQDKSYSVQLELNLHHAKTNAYAIS
jgi:two-component system LytT family sensor kinase